MGTGKLPLRVPTNTGKLPLTPEKWLHYRVERWYHHHIWELFYNFVANMHVRLLVPVGRKGVTWKVTDWLLGLRELLRSWNDYISFLSVWWIPFFFFFRHLRFSRVTKSRKEKKILQEVKGGLSLVSSSNLNVSGISILNNGIVQRLLILIRFRNQSLTKMVTS